MLEQLTANERIMVDFLYVELEEAMNQMERHNSNLEDRQPINATYSQAMLTKWTREYEKLNGQLAVFKKLNADRVKLSLIQL
jgi:hypothetical protein